MRDEVTHDLRGWSLAVLALLLVHAANHVRRGEAHDLLWFCNVAGVFLAAGCLTRRARLVGPAFLWLAVGTPIWAVDALVTGDLVLTSLPYHWGALGVATLAVRRLGMPRASWYLAAAGGLLFSGLARLLTPARYNVDFAFSTWPGWERLIPSHALFCALLWLVTCAAFFGMVQGLTRVFPVQPRAPAAMP